MNHVAGRSLSWTAAAALAATLVCAGCQSAHPPDSQAGAGPGAGLVIPPAREDPPLPAPAAEAMHVTGAFQSYNGVTQVPRGLFGVHATHPTPQQVELWGIESFRQIYQQPSPKPVMPGDKGVPGAPDWVIPANMKQILETWYDRYQPALMLTAPKTWKQDLRTLVEAYGRNAAGTGMEHHIEFWNEPFVNWNKGPGVNVDGAYYDQTDTTEGKPMFRPGASEASPWLVWAKPQLRAVDVENGAVSYLAMRYGPRQVKDAQTGQNRPIQDGDIIEFRDRKYRMVLTPWGVDNSNEPGIPGLQHAAYYNEMFAEFAKVTHELAPGVSVVGGWGFHMYSGNWNAWEKLYKPLIDLANPWIDGVCEHHYGGDPRQTLASYEVVTAYTDTTYQRRLRMYNTEAGLSAGKPPIPKPGQDPQEVAFRYGVRWLEYMLRDVTMTLWFTPDKAFTRYEHEPHNNTGSELAFRLLRELRGPMLYCVTPDPRLWMIATVNGEELCVVAFNDNADERTIPLVVDAPRGMRLVSGTTQSARVLNTVMTLHHEGLTVPAPARRWETQATIPAKSAIKWLFKLRGSGDGQPVVRIAQVYSSIVLADIEPGKSVQGKLTIPAEALGAARSVTLRYMLDNWTDATGKFTLNGTPVTLQNGERWLNETRLAPGALTAENQLEFALDASVKKPAKVGAVSVLLMSGWELPSATPAPPAANAVK